MFFRYNGEKRKAYDLDNLYSGSCFLVGGSPQLKEIDLSLLEDKGVVTMAMNNTASMFKPTMWIGADIPDNYAPSILLDPSYAKFTYISRASYLAGGKKWKDIPNTVFFGSYSEMKFNTFFDKGRDFVWWKNVFMLAIQVLYRLGFNKIYTVGCGFNIDKDNQYCFDSNLNDAAIEYNQKTYNCVVNQVMQLTPYVPKDFEIISCTPDSKLNSIVGYITLEDALKEAKSGLPQTDTVNVRHPVETLAETQENEKSS